MKALILMFLAFGLVSASHSAEVSTDGSLSKFFEQSAEGEVVSCRCRVRLGVSLVDQVDYVSGSSEAKVRHRCRYISTGYMGTLDEAVTAEITSCEQL